MTMIRLYGAVILVAALVGSVFGAGNPYIRAHNQFLSFFPASEDFLPGIIQSNCAGQFANYTNQSLPDGEGHAWAGKLIDCVLPACTQGYQNEFTVSGLLIGLLPAGLSQFGPSMADLALLATRRPVLAFLLAFGTPSPNLGLQGGLINRDLASYVLTVSTVGFPRWLMRAPWVVRAAISCVEYLVGMLATGNVVYQVYRLTYKAVSQATVSIKIPNVPETYILFFWMVVMVPIFGIAYSTLRAGYSIMSSKAIQRRSAVVTWVLDEFTPSLYGRPLRLERRPGGWVYLHIVLGWFGSVLSILHIWLGTVVLGSILFVTLPDMLTVVEALVGCALLSRIVLAFELHGIKQVSSAELVRYYSVDAETPREVKRDAGGGAEGLEPMRLD
ncbi:hypothetical protein Trihar35433_3288 [Trichoderma harzianum]|nr:hypothetical protein Trihar35433_3288 [Trichoderma harzianum]